jgi:hypothetical protein
MFWRRIDGRPFRLLISIFFALISSWTILDLFQTHRNGWTRTATAGQSIEVTAADKNGNAASNGKQTAAPLTGARDDFASDGNLSRRCKILGQNEYVTLLWTHAEQNSVPPLVAEAVAHVESRFHPFKIGKVGEIGLMQIRPSTAAMLGFHGNFIELTEPATNIKYGVAYLARAWRLADGDLCRALMKYRAGHRATHMTRLSIRYCELVKSYLQQASLAEPIPPTWSYHDEVAVRVSLRRDSTP